MGCTNCGSGSSGGGCSSGGSCGSSNGRCGSPDVFDWLSNMQLPGGKSSFDVVEVRFKHNRKAFYRNIKDLELRSGDTIVVEATPGLDVGVVSVTGELARIQLRRKEPNFKVNEAKKVVRHASQQDIDKWVESYKLEEPTMRKARDLAKNLSLEMKISDVEYQGDGSKATFYYTAEDRVDFRQLIKDMASEFKVRIEMRQIGARQEAARLGGLSSCGRELCCSTWLKDLRTVSTTAARYQQLSLNPQKLAGQCGKLKCCLNFELDAYIEALKDFPPTNIKLKTKKGLGVHVKTDVFKGMMWYLNLTEDKTQQTLVAIAPARVKEIIELNKKDQFPEDLADFEEVVEVKEENLTHVLGQDNLNRFDDSFSKKKKKKKPKRRKPEDKKDAVATKEASSQAPQKKAEPKEASDSAKKTGEGNQPKGQRKGNQNNRRRNTNNRKKSDNENPQ